MSDGIWQDARYALRVMRRKPAFTALATLTLALGIGVNVASLAVAYGILVRPLPYAEPSKVVILNLLFADGGDLGFSPSALREWLPRLSTAEAAAGYYRREVTVRSKGHSTVLPAALVTDRFFDVLGTPAELGRPPRETDPPGVVVGRRAMNQMLPGGPASEIVGTLVSVSDSAHPIGAVMPSDFAFPDDEIGLWLRSPALVPGIKPEDSGYSKIVVRLKPGVTVDEARNDANRVRLEINPKSTETISVDVLGEAAVGGLRRPLMIAVAGALLVLFVSCANVATLFIGRDVMRQRELAARLALGATTSQLVRSVLVETTLIAVTASLLGMGLGAATLKIFVSQASGSISGLHRVAMGFPIAIAIAALTFIVTLICAAVPLWNAVRADVSPSLRATLARPRNRQVRAALVVAQIACSSVLLIGSGLLARTVSVLMHEDHGFQPDGALEAKAVLSDAVLFDGTGRETFVRNLVERVRAMPGVLAAGFGASLPPRPPLITIAIRLVSDNRDEMRFMKVASVTPGYLPAIGARFISGRDFNEMDGRSGAAIVLSESAARFYFPGEDPIGRIVARLPRILGLSADAQVIGVVHDIKHEGLDSPAPTAVYIPWERRPMGSGYLIVRATGNPLRLAPDIRRAAQTLDPRVPIPELQLLTDAMAQSIASRRMRALPAVGFGVLSLGVAFVGVLATLSTLLVERRRDLAIRAALGASPGRLTWTIMRQGLTLTTLGLATGLGLGGAAARGLSSFLYGVTPYDATTFLGTALVIGGGSVLMTYAAARQARRVDPLVILRSE